MSKNEPENPAGPTTKDTRCMLCRARRGANHDWRFVRSDTEYGFAGYFCNSDCLGEYLALDEMKKLELIFGDVGTALTFLAEVEAGKWKRENVPDEFGVPVFSQRLKIADSTIYMERAGKSVFLHKLARYRLEGFRRSQSFGVGRIW